MVEEAGDVGEEGAVVVGPALGSQKATGPRKSPNQARSRAFVSARPRYLGTGAVRGMVESNRVRERFKQSLCKLVYAAAGMNQEEEQTRRRWEEGACLVLGPGRRARALSLTRPVRRVGKMS